MRNGLIEDTDLAISQLKGVVPDSIIRTLVDIGIARLSVGKERCGTTFITLTPESDLWFTDHFGVVEICHSLCDPRSNLGTKWHLDNIEYKRSEGEGDGWYLYTDSDRDPF